MRKLQSVTALLSQRVLYEAFRHVKAHKVGGMMQSLKCVRSEPGGGSLSCCFVRT